jgi:hypothetical protein
MAEGGRDMGAARSVERWYCDMEKASLGLLAAVEALEAADAGV